MTFELTESQAQLLLEHLGRQIERLEIEKIHTSTRGFRTDLGSEIEQLRQVHERLTQQLWAADENQASP